MRALLTVTSLTNLLRSICAAAKAIVPMLAVLQLQFWDEQHYHLIASDQQLEAA